jgi:hypothetical protein
MAFVDQIEVNGIMSRTNNHAITCTYTTNLIWDDFSVK